MALRVLRVGVGLLLGVSGALMYAASWQRWADACPWGESESALCTVRQDNLYDFLPPTAPWVPVGDAAQLAGWSLLVLALAYVAVPFALTGRRPGVVSAVGLVAVVLAHVSLGVATRRSGLTGTVVAPVLSDLVLYVWILVPPALLVRFAVVARGWALASAVCLLLATPFVAAFSYAIGPYDAQPWWEASSGLFTIVSGLCLLGAAVFGGRPRTRQRIGTLAVGTPRQDAAPG
jgi:hypothetical protein